MKKKVLSVLLVAAMTLSLAACGGESGNSSGNNAGNNNSNNSGSNNSGSSNSGSSNSGNSNSADFANGKFTETRHITVEIYDRQNDGGTDPENNMYTDYIKKGMLEEHNVEVTFKKIPRWTEGDEINNLLAAGSAPDVCVTYSYPTILTYADMGGVIDLSEYIETYRSELPNLWGWLGDTNMLWDKDPKTGTVWALEGRRAEQQRTITFVRQDWLDKLGLKAPTTTQEFEDMLIAFRDNADKLLGKDAKNMIPFSISTDIGWRASNLIESFIDPNITDKEFYINGFDDRMATQTTTKEAIRLLNKWYNMDLVWKDFAVNTDSAAEDALIKSGYVGAFTHNWDMPFRGGEDSYNSNLKRMVGDDAKYVPVDCFTNSAGKHAKWSYSSAGDRKIFFPSTNTEVLASLLYCDFISKPETIAYLQMGDEGVTHTKQSNGAISIISANGTPAVQNSGKNIDYTITCNGTYYGDWELGNKSLYYGYADQDPELVRQADAVSKNDAIAPKNVNVGVIAAEAEVGKTLESKRDSMYDMSVVASVDQFDKVWDDAMKDYLSAGGQNIMDERKAKWEEFFGSATALPELK